MSDYENLALAAAAKKKRKLEAEFPDTPGGVSTNSEAVDQFGGKMRDNARSTNMLEQTGIGANEGIAGFAGLPVDAMTGALNLGTWGINSLTGSNIPQIEKPVGGSEYLNEKRQQVLRDVPPETTAQEYGRRIGQEVGAAAIPGGAVAALPGTLGQAARASLTQYLTTEGAGAVGAGIGGQTAEEIAPDSVFAQILGQLLGGTVGAGATTFANPRPQAPTMDELRARQKDAYDRVDSSTSRLTPQSTQDLQNAVRARSARDTMDPILAPKASRTAGIIDEMQTPTITEVEKARRLTSRVAGNVDPTESGLGMGMKDEITNYLDNLKASDVSGGDPEAAIAALREGRETTRRIKSSEKITEALTKGERRAATSGTGGNEVNAVRQNIRSILDNPKKRAGFTREEIEAMESIVRGSPTQNALRMLGRFSPTSGALPAMGGLTSTGVFGPLGAVPSFVGYAAKGGAEYSTQRSISELQDLIRNGAPLDPKRMTGAQKSAIAALLASQLSGGGDQ